MENARELCDILFTDVKKQMDLLYSILDIVGQAYIEDLKKKHGCDIVTKWIASGELDMVCVTGEDYNTYYFQRGDKRGCDKVIMNNKTLEIRVIRNY